MMKKMEHILFMGIDRKIVNIKFILKKMINTIMEVIGEIFEH